MLKVAFSRGLMFNFGKKGKVVLGGVSLFYGSVYYNRYRDYTQTLRMELAANGINEADIDRTEELEERFTVDGPSHLKAALSSR